MMQVSYEFCIIFKKYDEKMLELFNQNCELFQKKIEALKAQILLVQEAHDRLLPKLMSGEIEI